MASSGLDAAPRDEALLAMSWSEMAAHQELYFATETS